MSRRARALLGVRPGALALVLAALTLASLVIAACTLGPVAPDPAPAVGQLSVLVASASASETARRSPRRRTCSNVDRGLKCSCRARVYGPYQPVPCDPGCQQGLESERAFCSVKVPTAQLRTAAIPFLEPSPAHSEGTVVLATTPWASTRLWLTELDLASGAVLRSLQLPLAVPMMLPGTDLARAGPYLVVAAGHDHPRDEGGELFVIRAPAQGPFELETSWSLGTMDTVSLAAEGRYVVVAGGTRGPPPEDRSRLMLRSFDLTRRVPLAQREVDNHESASAWPAPPVRIGLAGSRVLFGARQEVYGSKSSRPLSSGFALFRLPVRTLRGRPDYEEQLSRPDYAPVVQGNRHGVLIRAGFGHDTSESERTVVRVAGHRGGAPRPTAATHAGYEHVFLGPRGDILLENGLYYPCGKGPPERLFTRHVNERAVCYMGCRLSDEITAVRWWRGGVLLTRRWPDTRVSFHPLPRVGCRRKGSGAGAP